MASLDEHEIARIAAQRSAAMRRRMSKVCEVCGRSFTGISQRRYCTAACRLRASSQRRLALASLPSEEQVSPLIARLDALRAQSRPYLGTAADLINEAREERMEHLWPERRL